MKRTTAIVRDHVWGILNAVVLKATNATSESLRCRAAGGGVAVAGVLAVVAGTWGFDA